MNCDQYGLDLETRIGDKIETDISLINDVYQGKPMFIKFFKI